eukprot:g15603.t1
MQGKLDTLAAIAEDRENTKTEPYRVLMAGDSTMSHQFGAICGFMGERDDRRYDPNEYQYGSPGCCMDTLPDDQGGGRGLCFQFDRFNFLDPRRPEGRDPMVDAYYFGSGLHLLHLLPAWPEVDPMDPMRTQEWLNYESLLEGVVRAVREKNGPATKVIFMTNHVVADELYTGDFAAVIAAYRVGEGNSTLRGKCESQVRAASVGSPADLVSRYKYMNWNGVPDLDEFMTSAAGEEPFTVDTYCEKALMDRRGSLQLSRRAREVMSRLEVPIVDAAAIVEGEAWASKRTDGRHYHPIVPVEVADLLGLLTAPPPPPSLSEKAEAHPNCLGDFAPDLDAEAQFCPNTNEDGFCCNGPQEESIQANYELAGVTGKCADLYQEVVCGICHPWSGHLFERLGTAMTLTNEFCDEFVEACSDQLALPINYCDIHTGSGDGDAFYSYPYVADDSFSGEGLIKAFPDIDGKLPGNPVDMRMTPDGSKWWVVGLDGEIVEFDAVDPSDVTEVMDIGSKIRLTFEEGLLSVAFSPGFHTTGVFYCTYVADLVETSKYGSNVLSKFKYTAGNAAATASSEVVLLTTKPKSSEVHSAGWIGFKPSAYSSDDPDATHELFWANGDAGPQLDVTNNGQNPETLHGSISRIVVDSNMEPDYSVPSSNPFSDGGGKPEICAQGFRNPFKCSFDRDNDDLYCGDVGHLRIETIKKVECGQNHGWRVFEGERCLLEVEDKFDPPSCAEQSKAGITLPIYSYCHPDYYPSDEDEPDYLVPDNYCGDRSIVGNAVIGGVVYRGNKYADLMYGNYVFAEYQQQSLHNLYPAGNGYNYNTIKGNDFFKAVSFAEDNNGEVYLIAYKDHIYELPCGDLCDGVNVNPIGIPEPVAPSIPEPIPQPEPEPEPVTPAPTTPAPVETPAPTTLAPVTPAPTTTAPVTSAPVTSAPTKAPTAAPFTLAPLTPGETAAPSTASPTPAPVTPGPTVLTPAPTTPVPTQAPTTPAPTTPAPTAAVTTPAPTTKAPTVTALPKPDPTTLAPIMIRTAAPTGTPEPTAPRTASPERIDDDYVAAPVRTATEPPMTVAPATPAPFAPVPVEPETPISSMEPTAAPAPTAVPTDAPVVLRKPTAAPAPTAVPTDAPVVPRAPTADSPTTPFECDGILSPGGQYCCPTGCGECGGVGCSDRPGGEDSCCTSKIKASGDMCAVTGRAPCRIPEDEVPIPAPAPTTPEDENEPSSPFECDGILSTLGQYCCPATCGRCGGVGCSQLPGGEDNCCTSKIKERGDMCAVTGAAPCRIPEDEVPIPAPAPIAPAPVAPEVPTPEDKNEPSSPKIPKTPGANIVPDVPPEDFAFCDMDVGEDVVPMTPPEDDVVNPPEYLGCFIDSKEDRLLNLAYYQSNAMTPTLCSSMCSAIGGDTFGVQNGDECWCGDSRDDAVDSYGRTDCDYACAGDATLSCGGYDRVDAYYIGGGSKVPENSLYLGCYADQQGDRALDAGFLWCEGKMTVPLCEQFCRSKRAVVYGVQYGHECWCGDHMNYDQYGPGVCDYRCTGDKHTTCGGYTMSNVYSLHY